MGTWSPLPWLWLAGMALLGWAPALAVSYVLALWFWLATGQPDLPVFVIAYLLLLTAVLLMLVQVQRFYGLEGSQGRWYTLGGGLAIALAWGLALKALLG